MTSESGLRMKYFVLSPESHDRLHAEASRAAMLAYADYMDTDNPFLAHDLRNWVDRLYNQDDEEEGK